MYCCDRSSFKCDAAAVRGSDGSILRLFTYLTSTNVCQAYVKHFLFSTRPQSSDDVVFGQINAFLESAPDSSRGLWLNSRSQPCICPRQGKNHSSAGLQRWTGFPGIFRLGSHDQYGINTGSIRISSVLIPYLSRNDHGGAPVFSKNPQSKKPRFKTKNYRHAEKKAERQLFSWKLSRDKISCFGEKRDRSSWCRWSYPAG